jgi:hypothetical protein
VSILAPSFDAKVEPRTPAHEPCDPLPTQTPHALARAARRISRMEAEIANYTGARWGEAQGLRGADVLLHAKRIPIHEAERRVKSKQSVRDLPTPKLLELALAAHFARHRVGPADLVFQGSVWELRGGASCLGCDLHGGRHRQCDATGRSPHFRSPRGAGRRPHSGTVQANGSRPLRHDPAIPQALT